MTAKVYAKFFTKTLKSSIMRAPFQVRAVFMHMLLLSKDLGLKGLVPKDHFYLSRVLAIPEDVLEEAIAVLLDRDEFNVDDEFEGRRLVVDGEHYRIVSWSRYQSDPDPTNAERQRRHRMSRNALRNAEARDSNGGNAEVRDSNDGDLETKEKKTGRAQKRTGLSAGDGSEKKSRKESSREVALRSVVETIARTRPAFADFNNWSALSKLISEFGEAGLKSAAKTVDDWSRVNDPVPYLRGVCLKHLERGANTPHARPDIGLG